MANEEEPREVTVRFTYCASSDINFRGSFDEKYDLDDDIDEGELLDSLCQDEETLQTVLEKAGFEWDVEIVNE